jgi:hypothetical protein
MSAITTDFTRRISESPCGHVKSGVGLEICKEKETGLGIGMRRRVDTFPSDFHHK